MRRRRTSSAISAHAQGQHKEAQPLAQLHSEDRALLAQAQALSARLAALNEVVLEMQHSLDAESMLETMARQARWVIDFQYCAFALREGEGYRCRALAPPGAPPGVWRPLADDAISRALSQGTAALIGDLQAADQPDPELRSAIILPLRDAETITGTLNLYARAPQHYQQDDLRIAVALGAQVSAILQNVRLFRAVTRAREELHTILESIGDGVLVVDLQGTVLLANRALRQLLHLGDGALAQRPIRWLLHQARVGHRPLIDRSALRALKLALSDQQHPGTGMLRLGDGRVVEWACAPLQANGRLRGFVFTGRDISAHVELEQLREDLMHMLVHDLRTPATSLLLSLDSLRRAFEKGNAERHETMLQLARGSVLRLLDEINNMLDVSKIEAGQLEPEREPIDLARQVEHVIQTLDPLQQGDKQVSLVVEQPLPNVYGDPQLLRRVFENLLGNALKFSPSGGQVQIRMRRLPHSACLEVCVEDQGPGVPEEMRRLIFEKFAQVRSPQSRRGTGLGLTFCKLVVESHGGEIGVRPGSDQGSIFWLRLPLE